MMRSSVHAMLLVGCNFVVKVHNRVKVVCRVLGDRHVRVHVLLHVSVASQSVGEVNKEGDVSSSLCEAVQTTL